MKFLDCTLRDGGYINNWRFNKKFLMDYIKIMEIMEIDFVEIGFINKKVNYKNEIVGNVRNLSNDDIIMFQNKKFKTVVMADYNNIDLSLLKNKIGIDLVRIAFHKNDLIPALNTCLEVKRLGYKVSVNAMAITNYNETELDELFDFINKHHLDILYIADSYGSLKQKDIKHYYELFSSKLNSASIGFHLHNNMNNAYSNYEYLTNITNNVYIDSTLFGMGRGAGNLQTELVLIETNRNFEYSKLIELLQFIQQYIKPIFKINETSWGYELDYLLSGFLKMHPNYVSKMRDMNISMENRFFIIEKMIQKNLQFNYFDLIVINEIIEEFNEKIL